MGDGTSREREQLMNNFNDLVKRCEKMEIEMVKEALADLRLRDQGVEDGWFGSTRSRFEGLVQQCVPCVVSCYSDTGLRSQGLRGWFHQVEGRGFGSAVYALFCDEILRSKEMNSFWRIQTHPIEV